GVAASVSNYSSGKIMFRFDIRARLYSVVGLASIGLVVIVAVLINMMTTNTEARRHQELKGLTDSVMSLVAGEHALAKAGKISEADAQKRALELISRIRYAGNNYFWVNDLHPKMLMHPIAKDLDGKDLTN